MPHYHRILEHLVFSLSFKKLKADDVGVLSRTDPSSKGLDQSRSRAPPLAKGISLER